jgi:hypothetical protein
MDEGGCEKDSLPSRAKGQVAVVVGKFLLRAETNLRTIKLPLPTSAYLCFAW